MARFLVKAFGFFSLLGGLGVLALAFFGRELFMETFGLEVAAPAAVENDFS